MNSGLLSRLMGSVARFFRRGATSDGSSPTGTVHHGTVAFWHAEEGWGAVRTPDRFGVGFAHFSHITGMDGYRELHKGQAVEFEWADNFQQDGCQYRVAWVRAAD